VSKEHRRIELRGRSGNPPTPTLVSTFRSQNPNSPFFLLSSFPSPNISTMPHATAAPTSFKLNTGASIPSVGLGTWQAPKGEVATAVEHALKSGYRVRCLFSLVIFPLELTVLPPTAHRRRSHLPERGGGRTRHQGVRRPPFGDFPHLEAVRFSLYFPCMRSLFLKKKLSSIYQS
jgi:hypothetical protein